MLSKLVKALFIIAAVLAGVVVTLALVVIESDPTVRPQGAPTAEDVTKTRRVFRDMKIAVRAASGTSQALIVTEDELSSVARLGARLVPGFRGTFAVEPQGLEMRASVPLTLLGTTRWINLAVSVPRFEDRVTLGHVTLGPLDVPPALALELGRVGANAVLGKGLGDTAVTAASRMDVTGDTLTVALTLDQVGENGLMRGVFGALRGSAMPRRDLANRYYHEIGEAMARGDLPREGSYLPYLRFTLNAAHEGVRQRGEDPSDAFTAALFALTGLCGARDFTLVVGSLGAIGTDMRPDLDGQVDCTKLTLNDRTDSRLHFTTAAAIQAASNRDVSISIGEFKELRDTLKSGGFDFTDMAANNSGIRLANMFMGTPAKTWPRLIDRIEAEQDVIISFDGIPQILAPEAFAARFGEIDSDRYLDMRDRIERKIDNLALHAPL